MIIKTQCSSFKHLSNALNHIVCRKRNKKHSNGNRNSMILFFIPPQPLLYEILFRLSMSLRISIFMVNLKEVLDAVNLLTRIHHPSHEVIVVIGILVTLILDDGLLAFSLRITSRPRCERPCLPHLRHHKNI
jgi:isoprenylcysteine carboxyl methyltransferase (ICMT) family protein YpbQ